MNAQIKVFKDKIRNEVSEIQKENLRFELKSYVATLSEEEQLEYRNQTITKIENTMAEMDKLLETYELMKNNMLQHS